LIGNTRCRSAVQINPESGVGMPGKLKKAPAVSGG